MSLVPRSLLGDDDFFTPFFRPGPLSTQIKPVSDARGIAIDVTEDEDKFEVKADVPGVKREDISVTVHDDLLRVSISSSSETVQEDEKKRWHRYERSQSWVDRAVRLPPSADVDAVKASCKDGVLCIEVPKKTPRSVGPEGRKVAIE